MVIEIAVSNPALDRENAALCAEAGVKEYWILLGRERRVEVYRQPDESRYQELFTADAGDTLQCLAVPGLRLSLTDLFS